MNPAILFQLIILVVLLALSAFFSSSETALTTSNKIRMRSLAEAGDKRAEMVLKVTDNSQKMLSAILIGNNIVNISASSLATTLAIQLFGNAGAGIATGILTVLILIFGEISPKTMATIRAEKISLRFAKIIWIIMKIMTPVIFIIQALAMGLLRLLGVQADEAQKTMTESELRTIVDVGHESGVIETEEKEMINNMFDFGDTQAREIMVPKIDMTFAQADSSYEELLAIFRQDKFTRIPVYEESPDDITGILNVKDLLLCEDKDAFSLRNILRKPYFTYEQKNTAELLVEMRSSSINIAIVLDEYGVTSGLITMEDLLEEIVGDIQDEYDEEDDNPVVKISPAEYLVEGSMNLEDLSDMLGVNFESDDYDSIAGYMIGLLDHLPKLRESVTAPNGVFLQVSMKDKNRIIKIYMKLPEDLVSA
ncbi:Putative Mg2+ and Co2+ transporter CorB [uncultured Roseburia sp.]|uniref:Hemolysin family protein n=1 Tax=Brotonthovivens ammoniilytica TaxID=2981725 RepID=A0ABT2TK48_9FIRM|nr:hemolysin family protein [Brotonthovivens ammoniilytica]MCU6762592.1 hemolysin family protein [Brotonthovivens ammoniilytica]SCI76706.1 Putative Mg2+ and Co2+ transporter CorB [uncultured Roseburia sp.]